MDSKDSEVKNLKISKFCFGNFKIFSNLKNHSGKIKNTNFKSCHIKKLEEKNFVPHFLKDF
jgi:hypothetical protein